MKMRLIRINDCFGHVFRIRVYQIDEILLSNRPDRSLGYEGGPGKVPDANRLCPPRNAEERAGTQFCQVSEGTNVQR